MEDLEKHLGNITLAPYIVKAMALIGVKRRSGSNMFRHQINTMSILLDYKFTNGIGDSRLVRGRGHYAGGE